MGKAVRRAMKSLGLKGPRCKCALCKRGRRFMRIVKQLPKSQRIWMEQFYEVTMNKEEDLAMYRAAEADGTLIYPENAKREAPHDPS